jgi:hypothetical protein
VPKTPKSGAGLERNQVPLSAEITCRFRPKSGAGLLRFLQTCLVRFDNNKYSVASRAVMDRGGRPVETQAGACPRAARSADPGADRVVIRQDGAIPAFARTGEHPRCFGRGETIYDSPGSLGHYVPVLARKPGALRNGAPFKDWPLPANLGLVRRKLKGSDDGDRQMVKILSAVLSDGLAAVEAACAEALADGVHSADVVLNILSRRREPNLNNSPSKFGRGGWTPPARA